MQGSLQMCNFRAASRRVCGGGATRDTRRLVRGRPVRFGGDMPLAFAGPAALVTAHGRVACPRCAVAATPWSRLRGLLGRRLEADAGLLIRPASSIHTCFMRIALDVVFLDAGGRVLRVVPDVRPWRVLACRGAAAVLELPAGACAAAALTAGDALHVAGPP